MFHSCNPTGEGVCNFAFWRAYNPNSDQVYLYNRFCIKIGHQRGGPLTTKQTLDSEVSVQGLHYQIYQLLTQVLYSYRSKSRTQPTMNNSGIKIHVRQTPRANVQPIAITHGVLVRSLFSVLSTAAKAHGKNRLVVGAAKVRLVRRMLAGIDKRHYYDLAA